MHPNILVFARHHFVICDVSARVKVHDEPHIRLSGTKPAEASMQAQPHAVCITNGLSVRERWVQWHAAHQTSPNVTSAEFRDWIANIRRCNCWFDQVESAFQAVDVEDNADDIDVP